MDVGRFYGLFSKYSKSSGLSDGSRFFGLGLFSFFVGFNGFLGLIVSIQSEGLIQKPVFDVFMEVFIVYSK